jgi:lipoprotein signal peptidase
MGAYVMVAISSERCYIGLVAESYIGNIIDGLWHHQFQQSLRCTSHHSMFKVFDLPLHDFHSLLYVKYQLLTSLEHY